jgi:CTP:molybdopterin cytidylyltransferase MocA
MTLDVVGSDPPPGTIGVLLAAGGGSRFTRSTHKLLAPLGGSTVFGHALAAALGAGFDHVVVVTGAVELPLDGAPVTVRHHPGWAAGQATSLQAGIAAARELGATAVVVGLGDQPFVTSAAWRAVARGAAPIAVATYGGVRGNPVRLAAEVWPLLPVDGDTGARHAMTLHPQLVEEVPCEGSAADIDTPEDLERWT